MVAAVTVATIVVHDGAFLLVEEETRDGVRLNQPAGHLEAGETLVDAAVRETLGLLDGHYALCAVSADEPDIVVGTRDQAPLIVGVGDHEMFFASAIPACLSPSLSASLVNSLAPSMSIRASMHVTIARPVRGAAVRAVRSNASVKCVFC
jgi:hypothetical protein